MLQNATPTITKEAVMEKSYRILADRRKMTWEKFLELRRNFVGGSEISAIIGCNPWTSPAKIFAIKKGLIKKEPATEACYWGNVMEPILRSEFSKRTGYPVKEIPYVLQAADPRFSFLIADLDGVTTENGKTGVIECKTANSYAAQEDWKNGEPKEALRKIGEILAVVEAIVDKIISVKEAAKPVPADVRSGLN